MLTIEEIKNKYFQDKDFENKIDYYVISYIGYSINLLINSKLKRIDIDDLKIIEELKLSEYEREMLNNIYTTNHADEFRKYINISYGTNIPFEAKLKKAKEQFKKFKIYFNSGITSYPMLNTFDILYRAGEFYKDEKTLEAFINSQERHEHRLRRC